MLYACPAGSEFYSMIVLYFKFIYDTVTEIEQRNKRRSLHFLHRNNKKVKIYLRYCNGSLIIEQTKI